MFKVAAVRVTGRRSLLMQLAHYLGLLHRAEIDLAAALREVADGHARRGRRPRTSRASSRGECDRHAEPLEPFVDRYGEDAPDRAGPPALRALPGHAQGRRWACCATSTTCT